MFRHCLSALIVLVSLNSVSAFAAELRLENAIQQFLGESPQLGAQKVQIDLAEGDKWRRFIPNEPQLVLLNEEGESKRTYSLDLDLPFPGKSFAFMKLDRVLATNEHREMNARRFELANTIADAYLECAQAQAVVEVRAAALSDYDAFFQQVKVRRGVTQAEKISAELESREARRDLLEAKDSGEVGCRKLHALLPGFENANPRLTLPEDLGESVVSELGPITADQARADASIDRARVDHDLAYWSQAPEVGISAGRTKFITENRWANTYQISMTLPIFFPFAESVEAKRIRSQTTIDRNEAEIKKVQATAEQEEASRTFKRNRSMLEELRKRDLPLGQALVESAYSAYRGGQVGYAEMLLSRRTLVDLRIKDIQLRGAAVSARMKCLDLCRDI